MIQVLIADDDAFVRELLISIFKELDPCFQTEIYVASNGSEALKHALVAPPDILVTDIRMPFMNGIELAEQIATFCEKCKFIFLSSYSDKAYLRKAIHLQAKAYVDKPIDRRQFITLLTHTLQETKIAQQSNPDVSLNTLIASAKGLLEKLWVQMLHTKNSDFSSLQIQCHQYELSHFYDVAYRCLLIRSAPDTREIPSDIFANEQDTYVLPFDFQRNTPTIVFIYAKASPALNDAVVSRIWSRFSSQNLATGLAAGFVSSSYTDAFESYNHAQKLFGHLFFYDTPKLVMHADVDMKNAYSFTEQPISDIGAALAEYNKHCAMAIVNTLFSALYKHKSTPLTSIRDYFCKLADYILRSSIHSCYDFHEKHTNIDLYQQVLGAATLRELKGIVCTWIDEVLECDYGNTRIVRFITSYIIKNYNNASLGLDGLCEKAGYSSPYLCALFKQHTGITINNFITQIRLEKACHLLIETDRSIDQIATDVGYSGGKYFSNRFKTHMLLTPSEYRKLKPEARNAYD